MHTFDRSKKTSELIEREREREDGKRCKGVATGGTRHLAFFLNVNLSVVGLVQTETRADQIQYGEVVLVFRIERFNLIINTDRVFSIGIYDFGQSDHTILDYH